MKFKYKNCINGALIAFSVSIFPVAHASIITLNLTGLWIVPGLPAIKYAVGMDSNTPDLRPDTQWLGTYAVNKFQIDFNTPDIIGYTDFPNSKTFNNASLIANPSNSFLDISPFNDGTGAELYFHGSFYGSNAYTFPNGIEAVNYQFRIRSQDYIIDDHLSNLMTLKSINTFSSGYISTGIGAFSSEIWNTSVTVSPDTPANVPEPTVIWLFGSGLGLLALVRRKDQKGI